MVTSIIPGHSVHLLGLSHQLWSKFVCPSLLWDFICCHDTFKCCEVSLNVVFHRQQLGEFDIFVSFCLLCSNLTLHLDSLHQGLEELMCLLLSLTPFLLSFTSLLLSLQTSFFLSPLTLLFAFTSFILSPLTLLLSFTAYLLDLSCLSCNISCINNSRFGSAPCGVCSVITPFVFWSSSPSLPYNCVPILFWSSNLKLLKADQL